MPTALKTSRRPVIQVSGFRKTYKSFVAVDDVSFEVYDGEIFGLIGPNGAGKTTTLRALLGIDHLTAGHATIGGRPFRAHRNPIRVAGALLTPDAAHPRRTARGHLRVVAASNDLPRASVDAALKLAGIAGLADVPVGQMSLGMRQRLGLATAMIGDPSVLILDEPHNGLDAGAIRWLRVVLRSLADGGRTVLLSTHLMGELETLCDDVVVIDQGRVVMTGPLGHFIGGMSGPSASTRSFEEHYLDMVDGG